MMFILPGKTCKRGEHVRLCESETRSSQQSGSSVTKCICVVAVLVLTLASALLLYEVISFNRSNEGEDAYEPVVSCYYNTPNPATEEGRQGLLPRDIHPHLCTHINVAFARILNKTIYLEDYQYTALQEIVQLKNTNPKLKILLSVGGSGNDSGFTDMVVDHASRKVFIRSIKSILRNYSLDGIDLDWEFPAVHYNTVLNGKKRERQHFSQLLREIRMEYIREKRPYLLTVAVASPKIIVDAAYDVDQLDLYADYVNIMTYDFHFYSKLTPWTGLNSPLYPMPNEHLYLATLNINYTVQLYISKGLNLNKIVVGIPTYAHTFTLFNANNHHILSPASGFGKTGGGGFADYPDVCKLLQNKNNKTTAVVKYVESAKVPYLYMGKEWISFEDPRSVSEKAAYIKQSGLRGAMLYSLNADDYEGVCGGSANSGDNTKFPLSHAVKNVLMEGNLRVDRSILRRRADRMLQGKI